MLDFKSRIKFLQDNKQVVYSIIIMIVIPGIVIFNTWLFSDSFQKTIDQSLQDKAVGIGESVNASLTNKLDSPEEMQALADNWKQYNDDTKSLDIYYHEGDNFKLVAGLDKSKIGTVDNSTVYVIAWSNNWPSAQKIFENGASYWLVVMPLKDLQGSKQALLVMKLSADVVDTVLSVALAKSYFVLLLGVVFIILLLFGNSRLFEYSILYNKIKEIDQMKDEFISMASHELRTPVTVIQGYVSLILEDEEKLKISGEVKDYLSIINISTDRLKSLIEDLLDVSRIEQGRMKVNNQVMDIWPIIEETVKELKIQADTKGLALLSQLEPGAKTLIKIDKDRMKQVLINIIGNSIKYTPKGSVEVKVKNKDKSLIITIKDTGIGMSAKEREHLFEKFYRVKKKETEDIVGTGLGLWITKQIVELMNGTIAVDSMEGVGTQITMELPLA